MGNNENEIGSLGESQITKQEEKVIIPQRLVGKDVVNCPIAAAAESVVLVDFCKNICSHFVKFIEDEKYGNRVECKYPRFIKVINVYGKEKSTTFT